MFSPEDCIGIPATDYLLDLGFICEHEEIYTGGENLDEEILSNDGHPNHSEMLEEYMENSQTCIRWYLDQHHITFLWSSAEISSISDDFPKEILSTIKDFLDEETNITYISDQQLSEIQEKIDDDDD